MKDGQFASSTIAGRAATGQGDAGLQNHQLHGGPGVLMPTWRGRLPVRSKPVPYALVLHG